jgi:hypothetical protein
MSSIFAVLTIITILLFVLFIPLCRETYYTFLDTYRTVDFEPRCPAKDLHGDVDGVCAEHQLGRDSIEDNLEINK